MQHLRGGTLNGALLAGLAACAQDKMQTWTSTEAAF